MKELQTLSPQTVQSRRPHHGGDFLGLPLTPLQHHPAGSERDLLIMLGVGRSPGPRPHVVFTDMQGWEGPHDWLAGMNITFSDTSPGLRAVLGGHYSRLAAHSARWMGVQVGGHSFICDVGWVELFLSESCLSQLPLSRSFG